tara:strand:- start:112518 stop:112892 length:375 start_codon:yes stop_codon:yes gene_type:complete
MMSDETPKPEVEESAEYENFLGQKATEYEAPSLSDVLGVDQEDLRGSVNPVKDHWVGMPEYEHKKDAGPFKSINVHFRNEEDYQAFAELLGTGLTKRTKSIWYPKQSITANSLMRWMQEDDADA